MFKNFLARLMSGRKKVTKPKVTKSYDQFDLQEIKEIVIKLLRGSLDQTDETLVGLIRDELNYFGKVDIKREGPTPHISLKKTVMINCPNNSELTFTNTWI